METLWKTVEQGDRITIIHDNRWLAIVGVPLGTFGLFVAIGPWLIESVRHSDAWPILVGGSLIGFGIFVAGLSLCFKYEDFIADRSKRTLIRNAGLPPFRRSKVWSLKDFEKVVCLDEQMGRSSGLGTSLHHRLRLMGPGKSVLLASDLKTEMILAEGERWATFLKLPVQNRMNFSREEELTESLNARRTSDP